MHTPASIAGHPIHPMLVPLPIGLWIFSFVCDLAFVFGSGAAVWSTVALYTMAGGIVGALLAAIAGSAWPFRRHPNRVGRDVIARDATNFACERSSNCRARGRRRCGAPASPR